ncbi:MAG: hypothetical protein ACK6AD_14165 [Cyanobacteriota bacterium]
MRASLQHSGAPRKIGFAATNGQGQRRPRHESQSALSNETGIFRDALKDELEILDGLVRDPEQLLYDLWMWIEGYYNGKRLHSFIGYSTPVAFEKRQAERDKVTLIVA